MRNVWNAIISQLKQYLGVGNRTCALCGLTKDQGDMVHHPRWGWFCDAIERGFYAKWEDHRHSQQ